MKLTIKGKVQKVVDEVREMINKADGTTKIQRRVVNIALVDKDGDFYKLTAFDPSWVVPKQGSDWETPEVIKYENFDGMVANIMCKK